MQKPKFKDVMSTMTFQQKKEYIWEYYRWWIISTILVILMAAYSIHEFAARRDTYLNLVLTGGITSFENLDNLSEHLGNQMLTEEEQKDFLVLVQGIRFSAADEQPDFENIQQLTVFTTAGEVDLMVVDEPTLDHFYEMGMFMPLADLNMDLSSLSLVERDGNAYGIDISGIESFSEIFPDEGWYLTILINSSRLEAVKEFLAIIE